MIFERSFDKVGILLLAFLSRFPGFAISCHVSGGGEYGRAAVDAPEMRDERVYGLYEMWGPAECGGNFVLEGCCVVYMRC